MMNETMSTAATVEQTGMLRKNDDALAFFTARAKRSANEVSSSAAEVFTLIHETLNQLLVSMIEKRTVAEFRVAFNESFPVYVSLLSAVSKFVTAVVQPQIIERLTRETLCEMEADFRDQALAGFGASVRDQAVFTVWTIRKVADLLFTVHANEVETAKKQKDKLYSDNFSYHAYRASFGLDCLRTALERKTAIYPEVLNELTDCLRSAVNAYAWVRQGVDLRLPSEQGELALPQWDDEDEELLTAAMLDMRELEDEASL